MTQEHKEAYHRVVSIVHHNTTPKQPPMCDQTAVTQIAGYAGLAGETTREKLRLAVMHGDLITDGRGRYCVTDDEDRLRRAAEAVGSQVPVDRQTLGEINKALMEL
jgi:purine nucleoside permease